jgi:purine catabolism regulator
LCAVIDGRVSEPVEVAGSLRSALADAQGQVRAAASRRTSVGSLRRAFHEARCALEATALTDGDSPQVASHQDLGAFTLLLSVQDEEALRLYSDRLLEPIERTEGEYGGELLRSLEAYIEHNGNWERAARQLYCHRHTLRYRIRKIEELTGRDLSRATDRIELWLALRARELVV